MLSHACLASTGSCTHGAQAGIPMSRTIRIRKAIGRNATVASAVLFSGRPHRAEVACINADSTTPPWARPAKNRKFTSNACHERIASPTSTPYRNVAAPTIAIARRSRRVEFEMRNPLVAG